MPRQAKLRICAVLAAGVLLFAGTASAYTLYRCPADGATRTSCCCPPASASDELPLVDAACCDVENHDVARADAAGGPREQPASQPVVAVAAPAAALAQTVAWPRSAAREHRAVGPPILLLKQSFLI